MERVFIVGIDSVVGANAALHYAERHTVMGVWLNQAVDIEDCHAEPAAHGSGITAQLNEFQPDCVIYCGPESHSSWESGTANRIVKTGADLAARWAGACRALEARFVMISSDAVYTSPWMFHDEESTGFCESAAARTILKSEQNVLAADAQALIVRSHAYGWSPTAKDSSKPCSARSRDTARSIRIISATRPRFWRAISSTSSSGQSPKT